MGWQSAYLSLSAPGKRCGLDVWSFGVILQRMKKEGFWGCMRFFFKKRFKDEYVIQIYNVSSR